MSEAIDKYLDDVLAWANLAAKDEAAVRGELAEHLHALAESAPNSNPSEVYAMLSEQFGKPQKIGTQIARSKGRWRTFWKRNGRRLAVCMATLFVLGIVVRYSVAEVYYAPTDAAAPSVPRGSRILVYKLARTFQSGDVVVFQHTPDQAWLGIVKSVDSQGDLIVSKNGYPDLTVPHDQIIGRVVLNTR